MYVPDLRKLKKHKTAVSDIALDPSLEVEWCIGHYPVKRKKMESDQSVVSLFNLMKLISV